METQYGVLSIWGLGPDLVSLVPCLGDALGVVGVIKNILNGHFWNISWTMENRVSLRPHKPKLSFKLVKCLAGSRLGEFNNLASRLSKFVLWNYSKQDVNFYIPSLRESWLELPHHKFTKQSTSQIYQSRQAHLRLIKSDFTNVNDHRCLARLKSQDKFTQRA